MLKSLFKLRGELSSTQSIFLGVLGFVLLVAFWWVLAESLSIQRPVIEGYDTELPSSLDSNQYVNVDSLARADSIAFANATEFEKVYPLLPPPGEVVAAVPELLQKDGLVKNTMRSIWLNLQGYLWAIILSIPIGFLLGLFPFFRGLFSKPVDAMRFLPLTALTGLFITWFGIYDEMKIAFLAFGIIVYLLPVVVQRIDEVNSVYTKTVFTLGATDWQTVKSVYIPSVMSKLMDDIRVLTAISWTYIIIAELLNRQGGVGSLIYVKARQGQLEKVFAILFVIILVGFLQDRIFAYIDKRIFPHKYQSRKLTGMKEVQFGIYILVGALFLFVILAALFPALASMTYMLWVLAITCLLLIAYGEFQVYNAAKVNG